MNKKKSKCCCVYVKPRAFGESSSEDEDECQNCQGHVEIKKKKTVESSLVQESLPTTPPEIPQEEADNGPQNA